MFLFVSRLYENAAPLYYSGSSVLYNALGFFGVCNAPAHLVTIACSENEKGKSRRVSFLRVLVSLQNKFAHYFQKDTGVQA